MLISGGDRHGCEPNALLNLTNAADFPEFVDEIRNGRQSTVAIMPQYAQPFCWRMYQNFTHVIADYPDHPEDRRRWDQRTFHPDRAGNAIVPMAQLWKVGPARVPEDGSSPWRWQPPICRSGLCCGRRMVAENETLLVPPVRPVLDATPEPALRTSYSDAHRDDYLLGRTEPAAD